MRVATRHPNEATFVRPFGTVGQVEPVFCNIRDDASVESAMIGSDAVVNCVGLLNEYGKNSFDAVQVDGAERVARIAKKLDVTKLVHFSAIGASLDSESDYSKSKSLGEDGVKKHFRDAVIFRPSVIFGP